MNILHLNTYVHKHNLSFPHYQLHKQLLSEGHNSVLLAAKGDVEEDEIIILNRGKLIPYFGISRFTRKVLFEIIRRSTEGYFYPEWNLDLITEKQILDRLPFKPDVIICYWTKFAFNQKLIYNLSKATNAPVLSFAMDMAPITGGCHYAYDCKKYYEKCGACPELKSDRENDISRITWEIKKKYLDKTNITFLAGSAALEKQASNSGLFKNKNIEKLLTSIDENIFRPEDKLTIRKEFGIPDGKKVIFFGAASLTVTRKGMSYLTEALNILYEKLNVSPLRDNIYLLVAGNNLDKLNIPFEYKYVGYLKTQQHLAKAYQAADLFVCPSIEDSGPIMINQSIMCGRPVVSFDMGVAPDLVYSGETGYRARLKDSTDLAYGLQSILELDDIRWNEMSDNCRSLGLEKCAFANQSQRLNAILKKVISKNSK